MDDLETGSGYSKSKLRVQEPSSHARTDLPAQALYVFLINHYICEPSSLQNIVKRSVLFRLISKSVSYAKTRALSQLSQRTPSVASDWLRLPLQKYRLSTDLSCKTGVRVTPSPPLQYNGAFVTCETKRG